MTKTTPYKRFIKTGLKEYDAKVISAKNCILLLSKYKATPKFIIIVEDLIKYFENIEEFEKCSTLKNYLKFNEEIFGEVK